MKTQLFGAALVSLCMLGCGTQLGTELSTPNTLDAAVGLPTAGSGASEAAGDGGAGIDNLQVPTLTAAQLNAVPSGQGAFRLLLTDAPVAAEVVMVEFCGISVQRRADPEDDDAGVAQDEWLKVTDVCKSLDLLQLQNGLTAELGLSALSPGNYGQIRLALKSATIQVAGETHPLVIPSGFQSGIKIGHAFSVEDGGIVTLAFDFDAAKSIHETGSGKYLMKPVIRIAGELRQHLRDVREHTSEHVALDGGVREQEAEDSTPDSAEPAEDEAATSKDAGSKAEGKWHSGETPAANRSNGRGRH